MGFWFLMPCGYIKKPLELRSHFGLWENTKIRCFRFFLFFFFLFTWGLFPSIESNFFFVICSDSHSEDLQDIKVYTHTTTMYINTLADKENM